MIQIELEAIWGETAQQQIFRQLLQGSSLPGTVVDLSPYLEGQPALIGVLATFLDNTVTLYDEDGLISERYRRLLDAPEAARSQAQFCVVDSAPPPAADFQLALGTLESPELGATLILQGQRLGSGSLNLELSGPGIPQQSLPDYPLPHRLALSGFHLGWFERRAEWIKSFPLGVDLILVDDQRAVILPRTTQIAILDTGD